MEDFEPFLFVNFLDFVCSSWASSDPVVVVWSVVSRGNIVVSASSANGINSSATLKFL